MDEAAVIMAAGKGKRMHSDLPKVLHRAAGRPLVEWIVRACREAGIGRIVVVVGHGAEQVKAALADYPVEFALQAEQLGTGHAAAQARPLLDGFAGRLFVLNGDTPLLDAATLAAMRAALVDGVKAALVSMIPAEPLEYGRVIRGDDGLVMDTIEERDCTPEQRALRELNAGFYAFWCPEIWQVLESLQCDNQAGEYYITDVARHYGRRGEPVVAVIAPEEVCLGVNTPAQLARAQGLLIARGEPADGE